MTSDKNNEVLEQEVSEETTAPEAEEIKEEAAAETAAEEAVEAEVTIDPLLAALNDKYLRICAEYDNFRKRTQKEKEALYREVKAESLKAFLPVYDNLLRALAQPTEDTAYAKGVEMIMAQFNSTMEKLGVEKIESLGQTFDPAFHNAVMHVDDEEKGENEIVEVFQEGFKLGDKVIRFAMVQVAN